MSSQEKQRGLFNQTAPKGQSTPSLGQVETRPKSRLNLKLVGAIMLGGFFLYTSLGEVILDEQWRWSTVTGRRAGNQEAQAIDASATAKANAAGQEEAARVVEQVKGESQKADIQTKAAGERVFEELPGRTETEVMTKRLEMIASCRDKRRQIADEASARCMAQPSMSEQACNFTREETLATLDQVCGRLDAAAVASRPEGNDRNAE